MATIGQQLATPDSGWRRIDTTAAEMVNVGAYIGSWNQVSGYSGAWNDTYTQTASPSAAIRFNFTGPKFRFLGFKGSYSTNSVIKIDGVQVATFSESGSFSTMVLYCDIQNLSSGEHFCDITTDASPQFIADCIDIDTSGVVKAYDPLASKAKSKVSELRNFGDVISFEYAATSGEIGTFANVGAATKSPVPVTGTATPDGKAYFVFAGYDSQGRMKLIPDRNLQTNITWDTINKAGLVAGIDVTIGDVKGTMRLLTGGISAADTDNEWDKIIVGSTLGGAITAGDNAVWNWNGLYSWTSSSYSSSERVQRGNTAVGTYSTPASSDSSGFRPMLLVDGPKNYFLFRKEDGTAHKYDGSAMVQVTSDWSALSAVDKETAFLAASTSFPPAALLAGLGKYKPMVYSVDAAMSTPSGTVSAAPKDRAVVPKTLISLAGFEGIDSATLTKTFSGTGAGVVAITTDLATYKTFSGGAWVDIDIADVAEFKVGGITPAALAAITRAQWNLITTGEQGIAFAYLPTVEVAIDVASIAELSLVVDMKGAWTRAIHAADFAYSYPKNNLLRVQFLTNGDYKVNYHESAQV